MASSYEYINGAVSQESSYQLEEEAQECVRSLLALKHRSVTPDLSEPNSPITAEPETPEERRAPIGVQLSPLILPSGLVGDQDNGPPLLEELPNIPIESFLFGSTLALPQDRGLVPDALFVAMAQMKPCRLTQADRVGSYKSREIGFVGLCCKHCDGTPSFGRYFPDKPRSLAQTTTSQTIVRHCESKCVSCPPFIRNAIRQLQRVQCQKEGANNAASGRPRYGARKVFFERIWKRLHQQPFPQEEESCLDESESPPALDTEEEEGNEVEEECKSYPSGTMLPTKKAVKRRMMAGLDMSRTKCRSRFAD